MIADWAKERGFPLTGSHLYRGDPLPAAETFDFLVIMGGPMGVADVGNEKYPFLAKELELLKRCVLLDRATLGICLGAQLIADALGARIYQNPEVEIGWFPVQFAGAATACAPFRNFPRELTALHWHGDTFDLPQGAICLASTTACLNQAFLYKERVAALQFHIEVGVEDVDLFLGDGDYGSGKFVQPPDALRDCERYIGATRQTLWDLLDGLASASGQSPPL